MKRMNAMSASSDRRKRQDTISAGVNRKSYASMEEEKKNRKSKRDWTIGTIVLVLFIAVVLILNSSLFYTGMPAVKIGNVSYNTAQFDYYFQTQYSNFMRQYGSYASMFGLDTNKPLKSQKCTMLSDGGTWYDYFKQQTISSMTQITALSEYAKKNNITLDKDETASIDSQMETLATQAKSSGYSSTKNYLIKMFGRGSSEKIIRGEMERYALAAKAYSTTSKGYGTALTDAELEAYYQKNKNDLDVFDYNFYLVAAEKVATKDTSAAKATATDATAAKATATDASAAPATAVTDETMAAAKKTADGIAAAVKSGKDFSSAVSAAVAKATASVQTGASGSSISGEYADWLKNASRKAGDVTVVKSADTGYYVVEFVGRGDNHYKMAQARHILVKAVKGSDGTYTDAAKATAKEAAQKYYDEWKKGEATEASFASMATEYSQDTGSASNGGLYDSIYKNEMVPEFNDFVFAPGRKPGDTAIVYGEAPASASSEGYAGYHVVYYVGLGDLYSNYIAKNAIVSDKLNTWLEGLTGSVTATTQFAIRFASVG